MQTAHKLVSSAQMLVFIAQQKPISKYGVSKTSFNAARSIFVSTEVRIFH
jgi:hypothetical protein